MIACGCRNKILELAVTDHRGCISLQLHIQWYPWGNVDRGLCAKKMIIGTQLYLVSFFREQ